MMTTETITEETNSLVPNLLNEKEPLEVPPISVERALTSCGAAAPKNHHDANTRRSRLYQYATSKEHGRSIHGVSLYQQGLLANTGKWWLSLYICMSS